MRFSLSFKPDLNGKRLEWSFTIFFSIDFAVLPSSNISKKLDYCSSVGRILGKLAKLFAYCS